MKFLRKLYSLYRPLYVEWTLLSIERKNFGPTIVLLGCRVNYAGHARFEFAAFFVSWLWGSHFAISVLNLNLRVIKTTKRYLIHLKFFKTLWATEKKI